MNVTKGSYASEESISSNNDKLVSTTERLRMIVQDSHLNFLFGAGTPAAFFGLLGAVEEELTKISNLKCADFIKEIVQASIYAYFFESVLMPNIKIIERNSEAEEVINSYTYFLRTINRILLKRHSSILAKQANIFTTNIDMVFEAALEKLGIDFIDGFSGKIWPRFDLGNFGTIHLKTASRFEQRSEIPVFDLVKIHGSAGWLQEEQSQEKIDIIFDRELTTIKNVNRALDDARNFLIPLAEPEEVNADNIAQSIDQTYEYDEVPEAVHNFIKEYKKIGMVNPDKNKFATTVLNETYYELIRRFANEMEKENSVLFVHGFSFRDEHLRNVVLRAARSNPTLQIIIFCFSRSDYGNYQKLIPDTAIKNGNILYIIPEAVEQDEDEKKATLDVVTEKYFEPIIADKFQIEKENGKNVNVTSNEMSKND